MSRSHYVRFGMRHSDFGLVMDFHKKRGIVKANIELVLGGVALEKIPVTSPGYAEAMVLISAKWEKIYFLRRRDTWTEDEYFTLAEEILAARDITRP